MRVDEARQENVAAEVEDLVGGAVAQVGDVRYLFDEPVPNEKSAIGNFPLMVVHRDDICVFDEKCAHGSFYQEFV
jgi:hypothetical protein